MVTAQRTGGPPAGSSTHGGGTREPPTVDERTAELSNNNRIKSALSALVLVLPVAVLIFGEALRHPKTEFELPIVKLKLLLGEILPIFLLLVSYMLHRAMRYQRILLWNLGSAPGQIAEVARISLDDSEAYKTKSAYYEDVLDPMAAFFVSEHSRGGGGLSRITWVSFVSFNVLFWLIVYGVISLILFTMCLFVTNELFSMVGSSLVFSFRPSLPIDFPRAIEALTLALSALLLLLAWLNATLIVLMALSMVLTVVLFIVIEGTPLVWRSVVFAPVRYALQGAYKLASHIRDRRRERILTERTAAFLKRKEESMACKFVEFRSRLRLFQYVRKLQDSLPAVEARLGKNVFGYEGWNAIQQRFGLSGISSSLSHLTIIARLAPIDLVSGDAMARCARLEEILDVYGPKNGHDSTSTLASVASSESEQQELRKQILDQNASIQPKRFEIQEICKACDEETTKILGGQKWGDALSDAWKYFHDPESEYEALGERPPKLRYSKMASFLLRLLERAAFAK